MLIKTPTVLKLTPLIYIFEKMNITHKKNTLWLNIGVNNSTDANYISNFTDENIFCFFKYLQKSNNWRNVVDTDFYKNTKYTYTYKIDNNIRYIPGYFGYKIPEFIKTNNKKISLINIDADFYYISLTLLNIMKPYIDNDCILVFSRLQSISQKVYKCQKIGQYYKMSIYTRFKILFY